MIRSLDQMVERVISLNRKSTIAVAWAHDPNTISAIQRAVSAGFADAILIGQPAEIKRTCRNIGVDHSLFRITASENDSKAVEAAVTIVNQGEADILMKGLVGSDKFLKAVMNKENGLMNPDAVLSYVGAIEIPAYHKLLFISDPAVIPFPTLNQKIAMTKYSIEMAAHFGVEEPKVALIGASEKVSRHFDSSSDYSQMCRMAENGEFDNCTMDGPIDIFLACDKKSVEIKGIRTPVNGEADILIFPSLEACNPFYKGLMLFAQGKLAGLIRGTRKPVILMSRSESEKSKFYCIALACFMA